MKLFEYETKEILSKYGVCTPKGELARSPTKAEEIAKGLTSPFVVKAQLLVAGRGKAGGIKFVDSPSQVKNVTEQFLGLEIKGSKVHSVLIEEKVPIKKELYLGVTVDRSKRSYVAIASSEGGVDIEEVASNTPEKIVKSFINPYSGFKPHHACQLALKLGYKGKQLTNLAAIILRLHKASMDCDAELMEMNPIAETVKGEFVAVDARLIIDDNAVYRHPEFTKLLTERSGAKLDPLEMKAQKVGLAYVRLEGNIGIIGNGAGLVMATLDAIQLYGGKPSNFLDVGGGASAKKVTSAFDIVLSDPEVEVVFVNILGGITRCDVVAKGLLNALNLKPFKKPLVIRLVGTNEQKGKEILTQAGIPVFNSMEEAAKKAVEIVNQKRRK